MRFAILALAVFAICATRIDRCDWVRLRMLPSHAMSFDDVAFEIFTQPHRLRASACRFEASI